MRHDAGPPFRERPERARRRETRGALVALAIVWLLAGASAVVPRGSGQGLEPASLPPVPVDLNGASEAEIALLPGLGPDRARRIVVDREIFGPFRDVDDVDRVKGVGAGSVARIRAHAVAGGKRAR